MWRDSRDPFDDIFLVTEKVELLKL